MRRKTPNTIFLACLIIVALSFDVHGQPKGDLNCDGVVNASDCAPFILAMTNPVQYAQTYPSCNIMNADMNGDTVINCTDWTLFQQALGQPLPPCANIPCPLGSVNTWGYWKNHSIYDAHPDPGWDVIGENTQFFNNFEDPPANSAPLTWYEILLVPRKAGDAYLILAQQYVAAYLNIANGANPGVLATALLDAAELLMYYSNNNSSFATYPPAIPKGAGHFTSDDRSWAVELASLLNQFNSGYIP